MLDKPTIEAGGRTHVAIRGALSHLAVFTALLRKVGDHDGWGISVGVCRTKEVWKLGVRLLETALSQYGRWQSENWAATRELGL